MPFERLIEDHWVSTRCVLIEPLDENKRHILKDGGKSSASGFITHGHWDNVSGNYPPLNGITHLYTCWHVVTGHDPDLLTTPSSYVQPHYLKVSGVQSVAPNEINGTESIIVPLFGEDGLPSWEQQAAEKPHKDFNSLGIHLPEDLDAVRLKIHCSANLVNLWTIDPAHANNNFWELGADVFVCGYPYGFTAMPDQIFPVFLKRSVAATFSASFRVGLLDSGCMPVMSGGPVFTRDDTKWRLAGMYSRTVFTNPDLKNEVKKQATALGKVMSLTTIQQSIGTCNEPFDP